MEERICKWTVELRDTEKVDDCFKRHTGIDMNGVPEKYDGAVERAKSLIRDHLQAVFLYRQVRIEEMKENQVLLEKGEKLSGTMPPKVLKEAESVICYVGTLPGYTELAEGVEDVMEQYFLDTWGTAYVEWAQALLAEKVAEELEAKDQKRTFLWSPGQHGFDLINQKTLFHILEPEAMGCTLTKKCKMLPTKSVSGIMGVLPKTAVPTLNPCNYCSLKESCPASKADA